MNEPLNLQTLDFAAKAVLMAWEQLGNDLFKSSTMPSHELLQTIITGFNKTDSYEQLIKTINATDFDDESTKALHCMRVGVWIGWLVLENYQSLCNQLRKAAFN